MGFCWPFIAILSMLMHPNSQQTIKEKWSSAQKSKQKATKYNKANWESIKNEINTFIDHSIKTNTDIKKTSEICNKRNTKVSTSSVWVPSPSRTTGFTPGFEWVRCFSIVSVLFLITLLVLRPFLFRHCIVCRSNYCFNLSLWYIYFSSKNKWNQPLKRISQIKWLSLKTAYPG